MADPRTYPLAYKFIPRAGKTADELRAEDLGGCDAMVFASIIYTKEGGRSERMLSMDGRTGEDLTADELFKTWVNMAHGLAGDGEWPGLPEGGRRELCSMVFQVVRDTIVDKQVFDHRALLVKYTRLVRRCGSWSIFPDIFFRSSLATQLETYPEALADLNLTDTEWAELQRLASEVPR